MAAVRKLEIQAKRYLLLDASLFWIQNFHYEQNPVLCIPESSVEYIFVLYHNSLYATYQGCIRKCTTF